MSAPLPIPERIKALHQWYCLALTVSAPLNPAFERYWYDWLAAGYNGPQLRRVIRYIQRQIDLGKRNEGALKLSNLLNVERFAEDLLIVDRNRDSDRRLPALPESERGMSRGGASVPASREIHPTHQSTLNPGAAQAALDELRKFKAKL